MRLRRRCPRASSRSIATEVTASILEAIKFGCTPWEMPWHKEQGGTEWPRNLTGRRYRGINVLALWASARRFGFSDSTWATEERWRAAGMRPLPVERPTTAIVYRERALTWPRSGTPIRFARRLALFNRHQVFGKMEREPRRRIATLRCVDELARATQASIEIGGDRACYRPETDNIFVPHHSRFRGDLDQAHSAYAAVVLHELVHWTGAEHRLNRDLTGRFGSAAYAMEELVAELGSAFLAAELGTSSRPRADHSRYIDCWLSVLKHDHRAILIAASHAERATQYLLGFQRGNRKARKLQQLKEPEIAAKTRSRRK